MATGTVRTTAMRLTARPEPNADPIASSAPTASVASLADGYDINETIDAIIYSFLRSATAKRSVGTDRKLYSRIKF